MDIRRVPLPWRLALGLLVVVSVGLLWWSLPVALWIESFRVWMLGLGALGVIAYIVAYIVCTLVVGPITALSVSAGLAYGYWGVPLVVVSCTLAAALAFWLGRQVFRDKVSSHFEQDVRLNAINSAIGDSSWRLVGLLRISPIIPYGIQNYLFSVTGVSFVPFILAVCVGSIPSSIFLVYAGALGQSLEKTSLLDWFIASMGVLVAMITIAIVGRKIRSVLNPH